MGGRGSESARGASRGGTNVEAAIRNGWNFSTGDANRDRQLRDEGRAARRAERATMSARLPRSEEKSEYIRMDNVIQSEFLDYFTNHPDGVPSARRADIEFDREEGRITAWRPNGDKDFFEVEVYKDADDASNPRLYNSRGEYFGKTRYRFNFRGRKEY